MSYVEAVELKQQAEKTPLNFYDWISIFISFNFHFDHGSKGRSVVLLRRSLVTQNMLFGLVQETNHVSCDTHAMRRMDAPHANLFYLSKFLHCRKTLQT